MDAKATGKDIPSGSDASPITRNMLRMRGMISQVGRREHYLADKPAGTLIKDSGPVDSKEQLPGWAVIDKANPNPSQSNEIHLSLRRQHLQGASIVDKIRTILQYRERTSGRNQQATIDGSMSFEAIVDTAHAQLLGTMIDTFIPQVTPQGTYPYSPFQLYLDGIKQQGGDASAVLNNVVRLFKSALEPHAADLATLLSAFTIDELAWMIVSHALYLGRQSINQPGLQGSSIPFNIVGNPSDVQGTSNISEQQREK